jgi:lycopene cyclase domain-containing protein
MSLLYIGSLIFVLLCLAVIDHHHKLVLFYDFKRTAKTILSLLVFFILWDILGVVSGIFFIGETPFLTGIILGPEFPLEELFFLTLLAYNPLIIYRYLEERKK